MGSREDTRNLVFEKTTKNIQKVNTKKTTFKMFCKVFFKLRKQQSCYMNSSRIIHYSTISRVYFHNLLS